MPPPNTTDRKPAKKLTSDTRFSHVQEDPRFIRPKSNQSKVKVDQRFAHMIHDKDFTDSSKIDKYGRVRSDNRAKAQMRRTYDFGTDSESAGSSSNDDGDDDSDSDSDDDKPVGRIDRARGEGVSSSSSESESDLEVSDVEWGTLGDGQKGGLSDIEEKPEDIPRGAETRRFACVNMDWDHVRAVDLLAVFTGFKPDGGSVLSVKIYPSEFGKERLASEAIAGPPSHIFGSKEADSDDSDGSDDLVKLQVEDNPEEFNQVALRRYELEKMKYYFAVVTCDSVPTATAVYNNCDGSEYEASANFFDLRFIPDDMEFADEPKDVASSVPESYEPLSFSTQALQHSKVNLTWDADEPSRVKVTRRAFTQDEVDSMDFAGLLASSGSEDSGSSGDEVQDKRSKYRSLLLGNNPADSDDSDAAVDDGEQEMEITFTPGLSESASAKLEDRKAAEEERARGAETTIERFRRIKKEKRERWRETKKRPANRHDDLVSDNELDAATAADSFFTYSDDDSGASDEKSKKPAPHSRKGKKGKSHSSKEDEAKSKAELELLLDGAEAGRSHFDINEAVKAEKQKGRKKGRKGKRAEPQQDDFKLNASDPRFSALYDSHNFAIDPNNPNFKKTKAMKELLNETRKRHKTAY